MSRHALSEKRPFLLASIAAAVAYFFLRDAEFPEIVAVLVKGAAVALLAAYAWQRHSAPDVKTIAWVLGIGALGDIAVEYDQEIGGLLFFLGHLIAISLYWRHRRAAPTQTQKAAAVALLILTPAIAYLLPADRAEAQSVALYALVLGGMAASAWASDFPRYRVGVGALLFVVSDLLIFAGMGPLAASPLPHWLVWPIYYTGQFLICIGVMQSLRKRDPELRIVSSR
ncbi:MAG: lysoplasmalogenase family protein [Candidatus Andeanibacterium colombiense]|uniref:Lysoplasmalogenase family protein n=1 Tax=Candidatus Andeanibacterium colombiense TaxID=3121345 RepID=A0AAJ5X6P6_9SPHN|nr:MAG: lysoplasmalogenase family protein [Sphingomonadaceae bacterium]